MAEILNFEKGATILELQAAVTNLDVQGILMSHCRRDKNTVKNVISTPLIFIKQWGLGMPTFADRGCDMVIATVPHCH
jgi:hypothetical protein